ncbi:hypothetical protein ACEYYA_07405 [Paracoccus sp. p3-h83]|uniref:hypothetical protein n=1 Tax=Paracoccus sp. p3-h83 TaxID=3342805 RepID=UPI0035B93724
MTNLNDTDLRAAVAAGHLTEAQASRVLTLAQARAGQRHSMTAEDEPFEFFRGFSEIFVSVGLVILFVGLSMVLGVAAGPSVLIGLPAIWAVAAWWLARYFTLHRRMNLPSMVLVLAYGIGVFLSGVAIALRVDLNPRLALTFPALVAVAAVALWFRRFRLPFSMAVLAGFGLIAIYGATATETALVDVALYGQGSNLLDLRGNSAFAWSTLGFGVLAFAGAMWFDLRDPHRIGRASATAFWLHLLAAPALVNTAAITLMNIGGNAGMLATAAALVLITLLALIIDRRSFLTAGIIYIAFVLYWFIDATENPLLRNAAILILLGGLITVIGTWWVALRGALLRALPDFPGKHRLPPYTR